MAKVFQTGYIIQKKWLKVVLVQYTAKVHLSSKESYKFRLTGDCVVRVTLCHMQAMPLPEHEFGWNCSHGKP